MLTSLTTLSLNEKSSMTTQPPRTPRRKGNQYSLGSIALTLLLVLIYWWSNGAQPETAPTEQAQGPTAAATMRTLATVATDEQSGDSAPTVVATTATTPSSTDTPTAAPTAVPTTEPPTATAAVATATATAPPATATAKPKATATSTAIASKAPPGMATITLDELPPEAMETIELIQRDGPFPFSKDGTTFQNRERLLPNKPRGYYREYTVITPGENDRGARRIIGGDDGELYYTADHYNSFAWILLP